MVSNFFIAAAFVCLWGIYRLSRVGSRPKDLPPGPPTIPILGNMHLIPLRDPHLQFTKWAKEYGPVYSLILGTKVMIVLSSDQAFKDLIDKRSAIYSDRPDLYIGQTIGSGGLRMLMMHYGPMWRMTRKVVQKILNINAAKAFIPYQDLENKQLLQDLLDAPNSFHEHVRRYASSLTASMVYAWRWPTYNDPGLQKFFVGFDDFTSLNRTGGAAFADFFPILQWIPAFLSPTKRRAGELFQAERNLYRSYWLPAKNASQAKTLSRHCFSADLEKLQTEEGFSDDQAAYISATLFEAGSDTTSSTLYGFIQGMLLYPEAQRKAQEEIDAVVGADRMPNVEDDMHRLPYIRSVIKESLRWMPTTILGGAPHAVIQDDEYMGYRIPKGASILNNIWAIHRDPNRYPEPEKFLPERYADDHLSLPDAATVSDVSKRDHFGFGGGRRLCQGMHLAERSLFLGVARTLWGFNITPIIGPDGKPSVPEQDDFNDGFVVQPKRFNANITPRSEARAEIIRRAWIEAMKELNPKTGQYKGTPEGTKAPGA